MIQGFPEVIFKKACVECRSTETLRKCAGCFVAHYCSPECQRKNWTDHQIICKKGQVRDVGLQTIQVIAHLNEAISIYVDYVGAIDPSNVKRRPLPLGFVIAQRQAELPRMGPDLQDDHLYVYIDTEEDSHSIESWKDLKGRLQPNCDKSDPLIAHEWLLSKMLEADHALLEKERLERKRSPRNPDCLVLVKGPKPKDQAAAASLSQFALHRLVIVPQQPVASEEKQPPEGGAAAVIQGEAPAKAAALPADID